MLHKRMILLAVAAATSMVTACAGGGGGGGGGIVTPPPPPPPPPPPYASNCATAPAALSCQTAPFQANGSLFWFQSTAPTDQFEFIAIDPRTPSRTDDIYDFGNLGGVAVVYKTYTNLTVGSDGLGNTRTGSNVVRDVSGEFRAGDGSKMTLFDIENTLRVGLDYVQLGRLSSGANNAIHTYFAVGRTNPVVVLPTTGTGQYAGGTRGSYITGAGTHYNTASDLSMSVDFVTSRVTGSTSNFRMTDDLGALVAAPDGLSFTITADVYGTRVIGTTRSSTMSGWIDGRFYGAPSGAPTEVGFTYGLEEASGGGRMIGVGGGRIE